MGNKERSKGRVGQRMAIALLEKRGYTVNELNSGKKSADLIATYGIKTYYVEVKNQKSINIPKFLKQARENVKRKRDSWMLLCRLDGGYGWLLLRQDVKKAEVWK